MKKSAFFAHCDLEVGDRVFCKILPAGVYLVYDVLTVHSYRTGNVEFVFHLVDEDGNLVGADFSRNHLVRC